MAAKTRARNYDEVVLVNKLVVVFFGVFLESYGARAIDRSEGSSRRSTTAVATVKALRFYIES